MGINLSEADEEISTAAIARRLEVFAPNLAGFGHQLRPDFSFWIFQVSSRENSTGNRIYWDLLNLISLAKLFQVIPIITEK